MKRTGMCCVAFVAAACSSGSAPGGTSDDTAFCEGLAARDEACGNSSDPSEECKSDWARLRQLLRTDMLAPLQTCLVERDCQTSDDACFASVGKSAPASTARDGYEQKCLAKVAECGSDVVHNDLCTDGDIPWRLFTDALYATATPCFEQACDQVNACLEQAFAAD